MRKRVYLYELDSVRDSDEEIVAAQWALYEEIVCNGHIVVLTYNQIVDSRGFLSLLSDETYRRQLIRLFELGAIRISQYADVRTVTQYLINAMDQEKEFIFSALPIKYSQKHLMALVKRSLIYSDLTELGGYLSGGFRSASERKELFAEADSAGNEKKTALTDDQCISILDNLYSLLLTILQISMLEAAYVQPRKAEEYKDLHLQNFISAIEKTENDADPLWNGAAEVLGSVMAALRPEDRENRSVWLRRIAQRAEEAPEEEKDLYRYAQAMVNLCTCYTYEASIANVSKHYDAGQLLEQGARPESFLRDFQTRLALYWDEGKKKERFLKPETNIFERFKPEKKENIPDLSFAVRCMEYTEQKEKKKADEASQKTFPGYENGLSQEIKARGSSLRRTILNVALFSLICVAVACLVSLILDFLQDVIPSLFKAFSSGSEESGLLSGGNLFSSTLANGIAGVFIWLVRQLPGVLYSIVFIMIAEAVTVWLSTLTIFRRKILPLSEAVGRISLCVRDLIKLRRVPRASYKNEAAKKQQIEEAHNDSNPIDYIRSKSLKKYLNLRRQSAQKAYFQNPDAEEYPLAETEDANVMKQLLRREETAGIRFGVVYQSCYHSMTADPIAAADGGYFAYERVLPAEEKTGVVIVTVCSGRFVLLRQFRHAIRSEEISFPRGFIEPEEDPEECVTRELKEELKNPVFSGGCQFLGRMTPNSGLSAGRPYVYVVSLDSYEKNPGHEGIRDVVSVSEEDLRKMIRAGDIEDGFTLSAYAMYRA